MLFRKFNNGVRKMSFAGREYSKQAAHYLSRKRKSIFIRLVFSLVFVVALCLARIAIYAQNGNFVKEAVYFLPLNRIFCWLMGGGLAGIMLRLIRKSYHHLKRGLDFLVSSLGLVICFPLFIIIALLVKMDSAGKVFFKQDRIGEGEKIFKIWKFRTMRENAELETGPVWADDGDPRVTRIGSFLRKSHLDELPQLINVLKGEMSLIGPRPERPELAGIITRDIPDFRQRLKVKPGITGLAQVRYSYGASVKDAARKLKYDVIYMKRMCLFLDARIALWTIGRVTTGEGAR